MKDIIPVEWNRSVEKKGNIRYKVIRNREKFLGVRVV